MRDMFQSSSWPVWLCLLAVLRTAQGEAADQVCVLSLVDVYGDLPFVGVGYEDYYVSLCQNPLTVASMYAAIKVYCTEHEKEAGEKEWEFYCHAYGEVPLLSESAVAANITDDAIKNMKVIGLEDVDSGTNLTTPVMISKDLFHLSYSTEYDWAFESRVHKDCGWAMYGFWGLVLVVGMVHNLVTQIQERRLGPPQPTVEDNGASDTRRTSTTTQGASAGTRAYAWLRKYVITPSSLPPYHRQVVFGCTIPTRLQSIVIYAFWILNIVLCAIDYRGFKGNLFWSAVPTQIWRYVADRTGIICYANLPLLWMFSGRNNIFIWLTGWDYSTFNLFHRHIARVATLQAIIHSIAYTVFYKDAGDWMYYFEYWHQPWWYMGAMATVSMSFLVFFSFHFFRRKTYEIFLLLHIALSIIVIVSLFRHTSIFDGQYNGYLWPLAAIWCFDRFARVVRLLYCNLHVRSAKGKTIHVTKATVAYHEDADILHVEATPAATNVFVGPGQHYYLYQPFRLAGWENHPFTLTSWSQQNANEDPRASSARDVTLSFWMRPRDGWTKQLKKRCSKSPSVPVPVTLLLEGPYGRYEPLWSFDNVLLIAGGSGIAAVVPYLIDHVRRSEGGGPTRTKSISVVWANRTEQYVRLQMDGPLGSALARDDVNATMYITSSDSAGSQTPTPPASEKHGPEDATFSKELGVLNTSERHETLPIQHGRPDIASIVAKTASTDVESQCRLAIFVCGPAGLADAARDAAYHAMRNNDSVQYFEEAFGW